MLLVARILVGLLLLGFGRRLYWLFVAGVGFVAGLQLAPRLLPRDSDVLVVVVALGLALVGALVAVVATKVAIAVAGFVAGGGIAALILGNLGVEASALNVGICLVAGIVGAVLMLAVFDWTLIALSSLAGASLLVLAASSFADVPRALAGFAVIVLAVIGALFQARVLRSAAPPR